LISSDLIFIGLIIGLAIVIVVPWLVNTCILYRLRIHSIRKFKEVENNSQTSNEDSDKIKLQKLQISKELSKELPPRKGLTRFSLMAATIFIIGSAIFYLVIYGKSPELLKTTLSIITGAFATIIGFYFGGRAGEIKNEDVKKILNPKLRLRIRVHLTISPSI